VPRGRRFTKRRFRPRGGGKRDGCKPDRGGRQGKGYNDQALRRRNAVACEKQSRGATPGTRIHEKGPARGVDNFLPISSVRNLSRKGIKIENG